MLVFCLFLFLFVSRRCSFFCLLFVFLGMLVFCLFLFLFVSRRCSFFVVVCFPGDACFLFVFLQAVFFRFLAFRFFGFIFPGIVFLLQAGCSAALFVAFGHPKPQTHSLTGWKYRKQGQQGNNLTCRLFTGNKNIFVWCGASFYSHLK